MSEESPYYFDPDAGERVVRFFEKVLCHSKGEWAGRAFILDEWQKHILRQLFGWKRKVDGLRRYRVLYLEIPRKNGKSTLAAGLALYLLFADNEPGAEVYSAAADREQASLVFDVAKSMVEQSPHLLKRGQLFKKSITYLDSNSSYKVISADAHTKHGFNSHGILVDELHAQPNRDLVDVLKTSTGARRQPLEIYITTAGYDRNSICWEMHDYALKVKNGIVQNDTFLSVVYAADEGDDWKEESTWAKANPGLGTSIKLEYLREQCQIAKDTPSYENTFKRLHLNIWTEQDVRWIQMDKWDACNETFDESQLKGKPCYGGLDLAKIIDLNALTLAFPLDKRKIALLFHFWLPENNLKERIKRDGVPYDVWAKQGYLTLTPGDIVDYEFVRAKIFELDKIYNIKSLAIDRWNATDTAIKLEQGGIETVLVGQGFVTLSAPSKEFEARVISKDILHNNNPIMRWMVSNASIEMDAAGNIKPSKVKSTQKIDGVMSTVNALSRFISTPEKKESVYKKRGIASISYG